MSDTIAIREAQALRQRDELEVADVLDQVRKIQHVMTQVMKDGEHYGTIPGTQKPTLLKPGAEKLLLTFRFAPEYESVKTYDGPHLTIDSKCTLFHIPTGLRMGSGEGMCTTKESKYAYRKGQRLCSECNADAIRQDRKTGGWYCWLKIGGCGAQFKAGDKNIESQSVDRVPNPDLPDCYNTVKKMANKRALVAAVLNVTAASDIFTQDLEDTSDDPPSTKPVGRAGRSDHDDRKPARAAEPVAPDPRVPEGAVPVDEATSLFSSPDMIRESYVSRIVLFTPAKIKLALHRVLSVDPEMDWTQLDLAALDMLARHLEKK